MEISIPKIEDLNELNILAKEVHDLHVSWNPEFFKETQQPITYEMLCQMIKNELIYIAKKEEKIVGYVIAYLLENKLHGYTRLL